MRLTPALLAAATATACLLTGSAATGADSGFRASYEIGLFGDMPYGETGRAQFPAVIADMNDQRLAFSVFDGDIKNGRERCDQPVYDAAVANFGSFARPVVYLPGDNEWTDCDLEPGGGYDPNERLALVRATFAGTTRSLGQRTIYLQRQQLYPENVRWRYGPVTFIGLNVPGSDNNAPQFGVDGNQTDGDAAEYTARNAANLAWLDKGFAAAQAAGSAAVMVVVQADMWGTTGSVSHYADTKAQLARLCIAFDGQVVLVNGDSHVLDIDKPLQDAAGNTIQNLTRVQTFGNEQNHWVSATVDSQDPNVFTFRPRTVRANIPAYVSP
jgi:hypothetical protein